MAKIKLKPLENYKFEYELTLQVRDINYGGHMGNDALVGLLHEARINFLREMGFSELDIGDGKTSIIMSDIVVNYLGEGYMFDDIKIYSHVNEIGNASFRVYHKVEKNDKTIALAEIGLIAFDYNSRQIAAVPDEFITALESYKK